ncbi:YcgL domain-containing protein [Agarivorans aestuarii]|uniref:YcgL domain-containing protein n=1 Tax=Agarivorans aestuarii TaxID=1563703 RepID=UPI001C7E450E|nr:YcgL domain-containing protein [Agarivorans aestuarii]
MFCAVYKSLKKQQTYLYIEKKDDFSKVPASLIELMGAKELVMLVPKRPTKDFASVKIDAIEAAFKEQGYYLQLPPPPENYLKQHLAEQAKAKNQ